MRKLYQGLYKVAARRSFRDTGPKKEIQDQYDTSKEFFAIQNYKYDQEFRRINKQKNTIVSAGI